MKDNMFYSYKFGWLTFPITILCWLYVGWYTVHNFIRRVFSPLDDYIYNLLNLEVAHYIKTYKSTGSKKK